MANGLIGSNVHRLLLDWSDHGIDMIIVEYISGGTIEGGPEINAEAQRFISYTNVFSPRTCSGIVRESGVVIVKLQEIRIACEQGRLGKCQHVTEYDQDNKRKQNIQGFKTCVIQTTMFPAISERGAVPEFTLSLSLNDPLPIEYSEVDA